MDSRPLGTKENISGNLIMKNPAQTLAEGLFWNVLACLLRFGRRTTASLDLDCALQHYEVPTRWGRNGRTGVLTPSFRILVDEAVC